MDSHHPTPPQRYGSLSPYQFEDFCKSLEMVLLPSKKAAYQFNFTEYTTAYQDETLQKRLQYNSYAQEIYSCLDFIASSTNSLLKLQQEDPIEKDLYAHNPLADIAVTFARTMKQSYMWLATPEAYETVLAAINSCQHVQLVPSTQQTFMCALKSPPPERRRRNSDSSSDDEPDPALQFTADQKAHLIELSGCATTTPDKFSVEATQENIVSIISFSGYDSRLRSTICTVNSRGHFYIFIPKMGVYKYTAFDSAKRYSTSLVLRRVLNVSFSQTFYSFSAVTYQAC